MTVVKSVPKMVLVGLMPKQAPLTLARIGAAWLGLVQGMLLWAAVSLQVDCVVSGHRLCTYLLSQNPSSLILMMIDRRAWSAPPSIFAPLEVHRMYLQPWQVQRAFPGMVGSLGAGGHMTNIVPSSSTITPIKLSQSNT